MLEHAEKSEYGNGKMPVRTSPKPIFQTSTLLAELLKVDPDLITDGVIVPEYEFLPKKVFYGNYKRRGPYGEATIGYLMNDEKTAYIIENGLQIRVND